MAAAHVCDVCHETIPATQPRTILRIETAVGKDFADVDDASEMDVCERCRGTNAESLAQAITKIVVMIRATSTGRIPGRKRP